MGSDKDAKKEPTEAQKRVAKAKKEKQMKGFIAQCVQQNQNVEDEERRILSILRQGGLDYQPNPDNLHEAAKKGLDHQVIAMLKKGFGVDTLDKDGNTPLFYASENDRFQTAVILLDYKANVNHKSKHGFTPLMYAAWKGHVDLVSLLIKHGADVKAVNANNDTALHFAALCGFSMVSLILRQAGAETDPKNSKKKKPLDQGETFVKELELTLTEKIPKDSSIEFQESKSLFGIRRVAREVAKYADS
uniref:Ankyrin repeat protein n=1 Tax=Clytia hemisphaerica TaxID=252671 RepID=A0A069DUW7_9CNID|eukprot:TCONS_00004369-protein